MKDVFKKFIRCNSHNTYKWGTVHYSKMILFLFSVSEHNKITPQESWCVWFHFEFPEIPGCSRPWSPVFSVPRNRAVQNVPVLLEWEKQNCCQLSAGENLPVVNFLVSFCLDGIAQREILELNNRLLSA